MIGYIIFIITSVIAVILAISKVFTLTTRALKTLLGAVIALYVLATVMTWINYKHQEKITLFQAGIAELNPEQIVNPRVMPIILEAGTNRVIGQDRASMLGAGGIFFEGMDPINVWLDLDGRLKVNSVIRNAEGQVVSRIDANQFRMTDNSRKYDFNFDRQVIEIIDAENRVILQVQLEANVAHVKGVFYGQAKQLCVIDNTSMRFNPKGNGSIPNIKPIFKHPGIKYIGQRIFN